MLARFILLLLLLTVGAFAQTAAVTIVPSTSRIQQTTLKLPSGATLTVESGAALNYEGAGPKLHRTATAADYVVLQTDWLIAVTSTAAARIVTLPSAATSGAGKQFVVKDESGAAGTNNITVKSASGTLDGVAAATGVAIATNYGVSRWYSDGTNWFSW